MKTLQNNFTTPEQSKRLLELGVPADSADCIHVNVPTGYTRFLEKGESIEYIKDKIKDMYNMDVDIVPIWSVGRLIEIYLICVCEPMKIIELTDESLPLIDKIVDWLVEETQDGYIDFSKLED